jgi:hypothetical protein
MSKSAKVVLILVRIGTVTFGATILLTNSPSFRYYPSRISPNVREDVGR